MKPRRLRRTTSYAIALVAFAGSLAWAFWPRPVPVDVAAVTRGPMRVTVDEDGRTRIRERYVVSAPLAGRMTRIQLHPGDAVASGQTVVAAIEPTAPALLDARARAEAEARFSAATAARDQAVPRLERVPSLKDMAREVRQRPSRLLFSKPARERKLP